MKQSCLKVIVLTLLSLSLFATGCERASRAKAAALAPAAVLPGAALKDLQNLEELRTLFNQDKGAPRLILLLSPT